MSRSTGLGVVAMGGALMVLPACPPARAAEHQPILDMHLHAMAADAQGPPPVGVCTPFPEFPAWDPAQPYAAAFVQLLKHPPCPDPVWSPMTDQELMAQTIALMERHDVFGVLSGPPDRVATWMAAAPGRFIAGRELAFGPDTASPAQLRSEHAAGRLAVLAEVLDAGFASRVLFGTDQMVWPGAIERSIAVIEEAPFLTAAQKRDIFYDNAARFLRLTDEERARHRGR